MAQTSPSDKPSTEDQPAVCEAKASEKATLTSEEDLKHKVSLVEASLYVAGRPLELKTICSITGITSRKKAQMVARALAEEYRKRDSALEVLELNDERFVMQLKPEYVPRVRRLAIKPLLTEGPLRTLSYIAYRQPVPQAKVVSVRGAQAYEHISELSRMGLISKEKFGKSQLLRTTDLFADYFNLGRDLRFMRKQLEALYAQVSPTKKEEPTPKRNEPTELEK
ncbi:MAG: SMC-Scp complex subunit ScpB [Candidatus Bathyarchaeia archaeon]